VPEFAHLPQVLGEDKKKLSKRHGAASVMEYQAAGYLPEALFNFLALLGWNPGDDREQMTREEIIEAFSIEDISKKSSVFDMAKLEWLNGQYLHEKSAEELYDDVVEQFVEQGYLTHDEAEAQRGRILTIIDLLKERCRLVSDFGDMAAYFFRAPVGYDEKGMKKHFKGDVADRLEAIIDAFDAIPADTFTEQATEDALRELVEKLEVGAGKLIHPTRLAVTGVTYGPGLFELLEVVGKDEVMKRLRTALKYVHENV
jgi:glutamyl-tRNA synthetase